MKDIIDSYNQKEMIDKYVLNSFAAGRRISMKAISKLASPNSILTQEEFDPLYKYRPNYHSI